MSILAVIREISPAMAECELSFVDRSPIDLELAHLQHRNYCHALLEAGCTVIELVAEPTLPDSVFVEDVALVLDEVAIMTRPGAESRRHEGVAVAEVLSCFRDIKTIESPATLDGGDVLRLGRAIHVGLSLRSNPEAIAQLQKLLAPFNYSVRGVAIKDCLHLKSSVTQVADDTLLVNKDWVNPSDFPGYRIIEVDPDEPHAANVVRIGEKLIYPSCFPKTLARLQAAGLEVITVDVSELQKAEGAVTCCNLLLNEPV